MIKKILKGILIFIIAIFLFGLGKFIYFMTSDFDDFRDRIVKNLNNDQCYTRVAFLEPGPTRIWDKKLTNNELMIQFMNGLNESDKKLVDTLMRAEYHINFPPLEPNTVEPEPVEILLYQYDDRVMLWFWHSHHIYVLQGEVTVWKKIIGSLQ